MASLCITLTERHNVDLIDRMADLSGLADMFEIRGDLVSDLDLLTIRKARSKPLIFTARAESEGGKMKDDDPKRRAMIHEAVKRGFDYVDVEYRSGFFDIMTEKAGKGLIVSFHDMTGTPQDLETLYDGMCKTGADVVKIAVSPRSMTDVGRILELAQRHAGSKTPLIAIALGPLGAISRIIGPKYGAPFVYASTGKGHEAAAGQIPAEEMDTLYGVKSIGPQTKVYGLIGGDVLRSLSPAIHNRGFSESGLDSVFVPLQTESLGAFFQAFPHLGLSGFSVTRPYKVEMVGRMQAVDATVAQCGSVNTVTVHETGQLHGTSTDGLGVVTPLRKRGEIKGKSVLILGAGGAARAAAVALEERGARVRILARNREKAVQVGAEVGCAGGDLNVLLNSEWDILVNATPVGGGSLAEQTLVPQALLKPGATVLDMIYDPLETRLLREAAQAGCTVISGFEMLLALAAAQFEVWTGAEAPVEAMRSAALLLAQTRSS
ncbi:MAG: shikimate dehydrogenase [Vicinamibacteria bacterium]